MPLTCVQVVAREVPAAQEQLDFVVSSVSSFLDPSANIPFWRACALDSVHLAQLVWDSCDEAETRCKHYTKWEIASTADESNRRWEEIDPLEVCDEWTFSASLKSDPHYHRFQFAKGCLEAVGHNNVELLQWIFNHFSRDFVSNEVLNEAARRGHGEVLQFFHQYYEAHKNDDQEEKKRHHCLPEESFDPVIAAIQAGHKELALWMASKPYFNTCSKYDIRYRVAASEKLLQTVARHAEFDFFFQLWSQVPLSRSYSIPPALPGLDDVAQGGSVRLAAWLVDRGMGLQQQAVKNAATNGHLNMVQWLVEHVELNADGAFDLAVENGHLDIAMYLQARGLSKCTNKTMFMAAKNGHQPLVQWLHAVFANQPRVDLYKSWSATRDEFKMTAMDAAAGNGHLPVLKFLRDVTVSMEVAIAALMSPSVGSKRKRGMGLNGKTIPMCTFGAMHLAIAGGHLEVVRWLRRHCYLQPTYDAMDVAAMNGHLELVKWLHRNTSSRCSTEAMNGAAGGGHLPVVKWLQDNRSEGCTTDAMDAAARNGHLNVVRWLHENRSEGCTTWALDISRDCDISRYLYYRRTESCSSLKDYFYKYYFLGF